MLDDAGRLSRLAGFGVLDQKLRPPPPRLGVVVRRALMARLDGAEECPVVSVVAPPGYGKTTLLGEWSRVRESPVAWISIDENDNDPAVFLMHAAAALDQLEPIDPQVFRTLDFAGLSISPRAIPQLAGAAAAMGRPLTLVLDDVDLLQNALCLDAVRQLYEQMPDGSQLVFSTRDRPTVRLARLRARGALLELGPDDLAMDTTEARALLQSAGADLAEPEIAELVRQTEGWPVGLYLAALALRTHGKGEPATGLRFTGDDQRMADYLRVELLDRLPPRTVRFLTRTSILDRLSGPLCDAVLDTSGSEEVLEALENANLLVRRIDERRDWYRYHRLFRDLLRSELQRREPDEVRGLHRAAAAWCADNRLAETALEHARAAHDVEHVAALIADVAQPAFAAGRVDTALGWFRWLAEQDGIERYPAVAALSTMLFSIVADPAAAEYWNGVLDRAPSTHVLPDGSTVAGWQAWARLVTCPHGTDELRADAQECLDGLNARTGARSLAQVMRGFASILDGRDDEADPLLAHSVDIALSAQTFTAATFALSLRALVAINRSDWNAAWSLTRRSLAIAEDYGLEGYITTALTYTSAARLHLHDGEIGTGAEYAARASRLRPVLTAAVPHISAHSLLELATVYVALADLPGARAVLRDADDILGRRRELGVLRAAAAERRELLQRPVAESVGASSLTGAELGLLPLLATYLTYPQIAEHRIVSANTIKTQVSSIHRKLGVSSRRELIRRCEELGLLG